MEILHNWFFHYNHYSETWNAVRVEDASRYFEGDPMTGILKADSVCDLQRYIVSRCIEEDKSKKHQIQVHE